MCYFYGWTLHEVDHLSIDDFESFWQSIDVIENQNILTQFTINDWPNMKKEARTKLHKQVHKKAFPKTHETSKPQSTKDIFEMLSGAING